MPVVSTGKRIDNRLKVCVRVLVELLVTHLSQRFTEYLSSMSVSCFQLDTFLALHPFCLKVKLISGGQTSRDNAHETENSQEGENVIPPWSICRDSLHAKSYRRFVFRTICQVQA